MMNRFELSLLSLLGGSALISCSATNEQSLNDAPAGDSKHVLVNGVVFEELERGAPANGASASPADLDDTEAGSTPIVHLEEGESLPNLSDLSLEELAEGFKTVIFTEDGRVLREVEPAWEIAERQKETREVVVDGKSGLSAAVEALDQKELKHIFDSPGNVGTNDNRTIPSNTSPWNQIVHLSSGCSGMYMGDRTLVTAAHCVINNSNGNRLANLVVTPYRRGHGDDSFAAPYGQHSVASTSQIRVPNAYLTALATARANNERDSRGRYSSFDMLLWDFAVIEFTAGDRPAPMSNVGWNGFAVNGLNSGTARAYGYPGGGCPGSAIVPRLCGMTGSAYTSGVFLESDDIDLTGGQSGGPWLRSSNHMVGISVAERTYFDFGRCGFDTCRRNVARKLDSTVWSWIQVWSPDW